MRLRGLVMLLLVIAVLALLSAAGRIVGFYTDWLWFREVQFTSVRHVQPAPGDPDLLQVHGHRHRSVHHQRRVPAGDPVAAGTLLEGSAGRIWINERLTYTHGYGAVVSPVNRVTREGLPEFWIKDIPPVASSDLRISRPELKRVIVGFRDRIAMEETLDGAMARVFGAPAPRAGAEVTSSPPAAGAEVKTLLDAAASALTRANEELRRLNDLLQRLREAGGRP